MPIQHNCPVSFIPAAFAASSAAWEWLHDLWTEPSLCQGPGTGSASSDTVLLPGARGKEQRESSRLRCLDKEPGTPSGLHRACKRHPVALAPSSQPSSMPALISRSQSGPEPRVHYSVTRTGSAQPDGSWEYLELPSTTYSSRLAWYLISSVIGPQFRRSPDGAAATAEMMLPGDRGCRPVRVGQSPRHPQAGLARRGRSDGLTVLLNSAARLSDTAERGRRGESQEEEREEGERGGRGRKRRERGREVLAVVLVQVRLSGQCQEHKWFGWAMCEKCSWGDASNSCGGAGRGGGGGEEEEERRRRRQGRCHRVHASPEQNDGHPYHKFI